MPSANDNFASATNIGSIGYGTYAQTAIDTTGNTTEASEPSSNFSNTKSAWYKFTPTTNGTVQIKGNVANGTTVYTGSVLTSLTQVSSSSTSANTYGTTFPVTSGTTYQVQFGNTNNANSIMTLDFGAPPANDNWANAVSLGITGYGVYGPTTAVDPTYATQETSEPTSLSSGVRSVWYKFTPTSSGAVMFKTNASTNMSLYTGASLATLTRINSAVGLSPNTYGPTFPVTSGTTYYLQIGASNSTATTVTADFGARPSNDDWANRTSVDMSAGYGTYTLGPVDNTHATAELTEPGGGNQNSVWYSITPPIDGAIEIKSNTTSSYLGFYTGSTLAALVTVYSQSQTANTYDSNGAIRVTAGTTYSIRISSSSSTSGVSAANTVTLEYAAKVANDDFANAKVVDTSAGDYVLTSVPNKFCTSQTSEQGTWSKNRSKWYKYVPLTNGTLTVTTSTLGGGDGGQAKAIYTGTVLGSLTDVSTQSTFSSATQSTAVTAGTTYWIQVGGTTGQTTGSPVNPISTLTFSGPATDSLNQTRAIGRATTGSTARAVTIAKGPVTKLIGRATTTSTARALDILQPTVVAVGRAEVSNLATRLTITQISHFSPPTHEEPIRTHVEPLKHYRLTWAASVVRVNGVLTTIRTPSSEQLAAAGIEGRDWFMGGHIYEVDADTAAELRTAGFTVN